MYFVCRMEGTELLNISQCSKSQFYSIFYYTLIAFLTNESIPKHLTNRTIAKSHLNLIETIGQGQ